jgi:HPt (histidine-containing phosphotransfer) domain-containing protein
MIANIGSVKKVPAVLTAQQKDRFASALDRVAGDEDLLVSIATLVAEDAPVVFLKLKTQLAAGELSDICASGHQLKGMLSTFETDGPTVLLQQLIQAARDGDRPEAIAVLHRCEDEIQQLINEIKLLAVAGQ